MPVTATGTDAPNPGSIQAAQAAIEKLLSPPEEDKTEQVAAPETEDTDDSVDPEVKPTEDPEEEETEGEQEESAEDETSEKPSLHTVVVDGKEERVAYDELVAGYSRNAHFTRNSQALAEQRRAFEAERSQVKAQEAEYAQLLPQLRKVLEVPEPNWEELRAQDPLKAATEWQRFQENRMRLDRLAKEEQRLKAQAAQEQEQQKAAIVSEQQTLLLQKLPSWKDAKVATAEVEQIHAVLKAVGYSEAEMQVYDHRAILLARMAAKYSAGLQKRGALQKQVESAPVVKPGSGAQKKVVPGQAEYKRLGKTGSIKDAAAFFETLL